MLSFMKPELHDKFKDFPLAPEKANVEEFWLSDLQLHLKPKGYKGSRKLIQTLQKEQLRYSLSCPQVLP